ncbi:MAG TPA: bifunctional folylpolyglutamate synthase/dihydrofolate synthase [Papillibacter sp.]|nr:bifunctional folylpolyglutamate synthase/dihydrofolate synthase [Papillibacter sp.]
MSYEETLKYIHNVKWQASKPGLSRTQGLLKSLGNPEKHLKFVHIAGTNGKGSTAACIASILRTAGYKTGLYTSPYILRFNERMQINGEHISNEELEVLTDEIRPFADAMEDPPTEFELITALAMQFFHKNKCDIVVLEVGMGGELDSTNVIDTPEVAVITAIGMDHVAELGSTISEVARAKAGIIKEGGDVVVYGGNDKAVDNVIEETCRAKNASLYKVDFNRISNKSFDLYASRFEFEPYGPITLPLVGSYQPYNAAVAVTAAERLRAKGYNITDSDIVEGLRRVSWPGRFEILMHRPAFVLDGAHNQHGILATAESLKTVFPNRQFVFLLGVMKDKDVDAMMDVIEPLALRFVTVRPDNPRAMAAKELRDRVAKFGKPAEACETITEGVARAVEYAGEEGLVCALGSLYFSGDVRAAVGMLKAKA